MEYIPENPITAFMAKIPRVEITAKALKVLKIEAALNEQSSRKALEALILRGASSQTLAIVEEMEKKPLSSGKTLHPEKPLNSEKQLIPQKPLIESSNKKPFMELKPKMDKMDHNPKPQLAKDEVAIQSIKELWTSSNMSKAAIAKKVGGNRSTVSGIILRLIKKGELADRPK